MTWMRNSIFLSAMSILFIGWISILGIFRTHFAKQDVEKERIPILQAALERERLRSDILKEQFVDFKVHVATILPEALDQYEKKEQGFPLRSLASVVQKPKTDKLVEGLSVAPFERAKHEFSNKNYEESAQLLQKYIREYPFSSKLPESYFLLMESYYQDKNFGDCTKTIDAMVRHFPENEMTGFALIRMAKIMEEQGRNRDASDIYRTVLKSFPYRDVASSATDSLRRINP